MSPMPKRVLVQWEIDIEEPVNPIDAAQRAWEAIRRPDSMANVFKVVYKDAQVSVRVDLSEVAERATVTATSRTQDVDL